MPTSVSGVDPQPSDLAELDPTATVNETVSAMTAAVTREQRGKPKNSALFIDPSLPAEATQRRKSSRGNRGRDLLLDLRAREDRGHLLIARWTVQSVEDIDVNRAF